MNRLAIAKQSQVVSALVEGVSINAACRMTGVAKHAVLKLLEDLGCAAAAYHHRDVRIHANQQGIFASISDARRFQ